MLNGLTKVSTQKTLPCPVKIARAIRIDIDMHPIIAD